MSKDEQRQYYELLDHAMQELWRLHFRLEGKPGKIEQRIDKRVGTIISKLWEVKDILTYETEVA